MEYYKLILGIALIIVSTWPLFKNIKRSSLLRGLLRIDTFLIMVVGLVLVVGYIYSVV